MVKSKSDRRSVQHKILGNNLYKEDEHFQALCEYNKALLFAESKENLALAYANRSAVYLELKKYDEALQNIQWARENGYPADKIQKLNEREEKCKQLKANQTKDPVDDVRDFFKLSYPPNPKIPFIADCLEIGPIKDECRRGIFTTRDLKPGDIVAVEEAVFKDVHESMSHIRCCKCLKMNMANLIPCTKTATLMFCSEACRDETYANVKNLDSMVCTNICYEEVNPERLLRECEDAFGGREGLKNFLKQNDWQNFNNTVFDFDLSNPEDAEYKQNLIKCILSLGLHKLGEFFGLKYRADNFELKVKSLCGRDRLIEKFLLRLGLICYYNSTISNFGGYRQLVANMPETRQAIKESSQNNTFAHIIYVSPFSIHQNNHCKPNTFTAPSETGWIICVQKPIKAGEELFTNYIHGASGGTTDGESKMMAEMKKNDCRCPTCLHGIPDGVKVYETVQAGIDEMLRNENILGSGYYRTFTLDYTPRNINSYMPFIDVIKANLALLESYYSKLPKPAKVHMLSTMTGFTINFLCRIMYMPCAPEKWRYKPHRGISN